MSWLYELQVWLETSGLYRDYLSRMPIPLNNIYFDTLVLLALIIYIGYRIISAIRIDHANHVIKKRQAQLREEAVANEMDLIKRERAARAETEEMKQLMTLAKIQMLSNFGAGLHPDASGQMVPYEEYKTALDSVLKSEIADARTSDAEIPTTAKPILDVDSDKKDTIVDHLKSLRPEPLKRDKPPKVRNEKRCEAEIAADVQDIMAAQQTEASGTSDTEPVSALAPEITVDTDPIPEIKPVDFQAREEESVFVSPDQIVLPEDHVEDVMLPEKESHAEELKQIDDFSDVQPIERKDTPAATNSFEAIMGQIIANRDLDQKLKEREIKIAEQVRVNREKLEGA